MLNFAAKHFRTFIEISLWINLVFCAIGGAALGDENRKIGGVLGLILGIAVGLLINIIYGGLLAIFINIDKGVKNMNKWLQCIWQHRISTDANQKLPIPISDDDIYYFDSKDNSSSSDSASKNNSSESGSLID